MSPLYKRSPPNHYWPNIVQPSQLCICSRRAHVTYLSKAKTDLALPSQINIGSRRARSFQNLIKKGAYLSEVFDQEGCILFKTCLRRANTFQEGRVPFKIWSRRTRTKYLIKKGAYFSKFDQEECVLLKVFDQEGCVPFKIWSRRARTFQNLIKYTPPSVKICLRLWKF